jgi:hypothetical protein
LHQWLVVMSSLVSLVVYYVVSYQLFTTGDKVSHGDLTDQNRFLVQPWVCSELGYDKFRMFWFPWGLQNDRSFVCEFAVK